jgi:hypothetical protein
LDRKGFVKENKGIWSAVTSMCKKLTSVKRVGSLDWRHLIITLLHVENLIDKYGQRQNFINEITRVQNHDVSSLMKFYNNYNFEKEALQLIDNINEDLIVTESSLKATKRTTKKLEKLLSSNLSSSSGNNNNSNNDNDNDSDSDNDSNNGNGDDDNDENKNTGNKFKVEAILGKRHNEKKFGREEYLIKWKGFPRSESTWEPLTNLTECLQMVTEFNAKRWRTKKRRKSDVKKMEKKLTQ